MKKFLRLLTHRVTFVALFLILQILAIFMVAEFFNEQFTLFYVACDVFSVLVTVYIINRDENPAFKIAWIIPIMGLPIFGNLLYLMFGRSKLSKHQIRRMENVGTCYVEALRHCPSHTQEIAQINPDAGLQSAYLERATVAPAFVRTQTRYFKLGDEMFPRLLDELRKAEKFIFMEYFIIAPGVMWDSILEILKEKSAQGVDVRLIYDDMGCIFTLPADYYHKIESYGIKCCAFHRVIPKITGLINNRDHRKICVIDGNVAFTGGVNLADEYINRYEKHGHWLDCGVMIQGAAAWSFTCMFLSVWDYMRGCEEKFSDFAPDEAFVAATESDGYVQPYTDMPLDNEAVGENVYLNIINRAKKYVYICTPYLVVDNEMLVALRNAAKSGVDVRIITPGIPDKWYVHAVTRSFYAPLIEAGVRIFEYSPGFIHSKTFVADDEIGVCGTINLDFRSLYLHYECAVWMYRSRAVGQIHESYLETLEKSREITLEWCQKRPWIVRFFCSLLRIFAPLM